MSPGKCRAESALYVCIYGTHTHTHVCNIISIRTRSCTVEWAFKPTRQQPHPQFAHKPPNPHNLSHHTLGPNIIYGMQMKCGCVCVCAYSVRICPTYMSAFWYCCCGGVSISIMQKLVCWLNHVCNMGYKMHDMPLKGTEYGRVFFIVLHAHNTVWYSLSLYPPLTILLYLSAYTFRYYQRGNTVLASILIFHLTTALWSSWGVCFVFSRTRNCTQAVSKRIAYLPETLPYNFDEHSPAKIGRHFIVWIQHNIQFSVETVYGYFRMDVYVLCVCVVWRQRMKGLWI